jgi:hypothetical protein
LGIRFARVIIADMAGVASGFPEVALPFRLAIVTALLEDPVRVPVRAVNAVGPAEATNGFVAPGVVEEGPEVPHRGGPPSRARSGRTTDSVASSVQ